MIKGGLHIMSLLGRDAVLATVSHNGKVEPTTLYKQLVEAAADIKPKSITIASSANVFTGDENNRTQVTQFVGMLTHVAIVANGSVSLIAHPSLTGINTDTGLSGTTQWHNPYGHVTTCKASSPRTASSPTTICARSSSRRTSRRISLAGGERGKMRRHSSRAAALDKAAHEAKADSLFQQLLTRLSDRGSGQ
jgi:RecA-family ATPase